MKAAAFLPEVHPVTQRRETSVFRVSSLSQQEIWELASTQLPGKTVYCRADVELSAIRKILPLDVEAETSTHPLHSIIVGWPVEKADQKLLTLELERAARSYPGPRHS